MNNCAVMYEPQAHAQCLIPKVVLDLATIWWDESWHNDACASVILLYGDRLMKLWADYPEVEAREDTSAQNRRYELFDVKKSDLMELECVYPSVCNVERPEELVAAVRAIWAEELVRSERARQQAPVEQGGEGYTPEHDEEYIDGELIRASICYHDMALERDDEDEQYRTTLEEHWPSMWDTAHFKPWKKDAAGVDRERCLIKAGALLLAQKDQCDRMLRQVLKRLQEVTQ